MGENVTIPKAVLVGGDLLPEWLRYVAYDIERESTGPVIRDLRTLADHIEAAFKSEAD